VIPRRDLKLDEPGFLHHPYFPAQVLWAGKASFSWYSLTSINNARRDARQTKPFAEDDDPDAEAAAKILVARALQNWEDKATKKVANLKRKTMDEGEPQKNSQKKTRRALQSDCPVTLPEPSVDPRAASTSSVCLDEPTDWDAYYAKPRNNTRRTKEMREQEEAIAGLEMKNASLKVSVDYQTVCMGRLEAENAALKATIDQKLRQIEELKTAQQKAQSTPPPCAAPRMPFHPEFLDFMRETFACEVMRTCNARACIFLPWLAMLKWCTHRTRRSGDRRFRWCASSVYPYFH
jgi:hypothetical protein